jgi:hypothetical protein
LDTIPRKNKNNSSLFSSSQITISYIEVAQETTVRQRELATNFFFHCKCKRCLVGLFIFIFLIFVSISLTKQKKEVSFDTMATGFRCRNGSCAGPVNKESLECSTCHQKLQESQFHGPFKVFEETLKQAKEAADVRGKRRVASSESDWV